MEEFTKGALLGMLMVIFGQLLYRLIIKLLGI